MLTVNSAGAVGAVVAVWAHIRVVFEINEWVWQFMGQNIWQTAGISSYKADKEGRNFRKYQAAGVVALIIAVFYLFIAAKVALFCQHNPTIIEQHSSIEHVSGKNTQICTGPDASLSLECLHAGKNNIPHL
ncbi:MAG: hypothetical protein IPH12_21600 [Saprospirales bacterium]|nr:hypothetical protein [Saprospirales bacterium]MBK8920570.1 hypothetical protein [Saprospirales bacterium]